MGEEHGTFATHVQGLKKRAARDSLASCWYTHCISKLKGTDTRDRALTTVREVASKLNRVERCVARFEWSRRVESSRRRIAVVTYILNIA